TFVFTKPYHDYPDLHSLPTRRSSDLPTPKDVEQITSKVEMAPTTEDFFSTEEICERVRTAVKSDTWQQPFLIKTERCHFKVHPRSEEHTSELQSRENFVCRLLLEIKN